MSRLKILEAHCAELNKVVSSVVFQVTNALMGPLLMMKMVNYVKIHLKNVVMNPITRSLKLI